MKIRFANSKDASSLLNIYSQYIDTSITFEYVLPTEEEFQSCIVNITKEYPYLVCEDNGNIIAYAYAHRHMTREAYQWNAELSIYIDETYTSKGLGKKLYLILMEILKLQRIKNVYGCITSANKKSVKFHEALGFKLIGTYHNTGFKCNKWYDVQWFEKQIGSYDLDNSPFLPINKISQEDLVSILK